MWQQSAVVTDCLRQPLWCPRPAAGVASRDRLQSGMRWQSPQKWRAGVSASVSRYISCASQCVPVSVPDIHCMPRAMPRRWLPVASVPVAISAGNALRFAAQAYWVVAESPPPHAGAGSVRHLRCCQYLLRSRLRSNHALNAPDATSAVSAGRALMCRPRRRRWQ